MGYSGPNPMAATEFPVPRQKKCLIVVAGVVAFFVVLGIIGCATDSSQPDTDSTPAPPASPTVAAATATPTPSLAPQSPRYATADCDRSHRHTNGYGGTNGGRTNGYSSTGGNTNGYGSGHGSANSYSSANGYGSANGHADSRTNGHAPNRDMARARSRC